MADNKSIVHYLCDGEKILKKENVIAPDEQTQSQIEREEQRRGCPRGKRGERGMPGKGVNMSNQGRKRQQL